MRKIRKYEDLPAGWQDMVLDLSREGKFKSEIIAEIGLTPHFHAKLSKESDEYRAVFETGYNLSKNWWLSTGRRNLTNKDFQTSLYNIFMKNVFNFRDTPLAKENKDSLLADKLEEAEVTERYKPSEVRDGLDKSIN